MAKKAEALTIEELKALCRFFHEKGALNTDFEMEFNTLMQGKYQRWRWKRCYQKAWRKD